jgi:hypothetical protein
MSISTIIMGASGSGKSTSLRNLKHEDVLLIQPVRKPLPFRSTEWKYFTKECPTGCIHVTDDIQRIIFVMKNTKKKIIVIDDAQYIFANSFFRRASEKGYEKFTEIGKACWEMLMVASQLDDDVRCYMLWHTQLDDAYTTKVKTIGKMLDAQLTVEGMVTIVLHAQLADKKYIFSTNSSGNDTAKSPMGLFESEFIDNDLAFVDRTITDYYGITEPEVVVGE